MTEMINVFVITMAVFFIAGLVKGVVGLGLPALSLALLTAVLGLPTAMGLLLLPAFVTNLIQALVGGHGREILLHTWPFLIAAVATIWPGVLVLSQVNVTYLSGLLGVLLFAYAAFNLSGWRMSVPVGHRRWAGPVLGASNGLLTGMTGSFVVPGVLYLQAIGLPRDMLVQAMGMLFTVSTVALAASMAGQGLLTAEISTISALAILPALIGMFIGQHIRKRISETLFRRLFFLSLMFLGLYLLSYIL